MNISKTEKKRLSRLEWIKNQYLENLKTPIEPLEQRFLIAKTKFLAQLLELKGLIQPQYRKSIIGYCNNQVEIREAIGNKFYNKLLKIWKENQ